jgi:hypothetical protein
MSILIPFFLLFLAPSMRRHVKRPFTDILFFIVALTVMLPSALFCGRAFRPVHAKVRSRVLQSWRRILKCGHRQWPIQGAKAQSPRPGRQKHNENDDRLRAVPSLENFLNCGFKAFFSTTANSPGINSPRMGPRVARRRGVDPRTGHIPVGFWIMMLGLSCSTITNAFNRSCSICYNRLF